MVRKKCIYVTLGVLMFLLSACGGNATNESLEEETTGEPVTSEAEVNTYYNLGDTVSTDILEFTLDKAELAIALNNTLDENYCLPKEYDAETDVNNPLVAAKGHSYAAFTYTISNLDRTAFNGQLPFITAEYQNEKSSKQVDGAEYSWEDNTWSQTGNNLVDPVYSWMFVLKTQEKKRFRSFIDIPLEAESLNDEFYLTVELLDSAGEKQAFTYKVKKEL